MKFLDGRRKWWHINAVFNESLKKEIAWCKIQRTGWPREIGVVSICTFAAHPIQRCGRT
jgi:hypothetical protein